MGKMDRPMRLFAPSRVIRLFYSAALLLLLSLTLNAHAEGKRAVRTRVMPVYPEIAKRMKIFGLVRLEAIVDQEGKVTTVKVIEGNQMLVTAAEEAIKKTRFEPAAETTAEEVDINFPHVN